MAAYLTGPWDGRRRIVDLHRRRDCGTAPVEQRDEQVDGSGARPETEHGVSAGGSARDLRGPYANVELLGEHLAAGGIVPLNEAGAAALRTALPQNDRVAVSGGGDVERHEVGADRG